FLSHLLETGNGCPRRRWRRPKNNHVLPRLTDTRLARRQRHLPERDQSLAPSVPKAENASGRCPLLRRRWGSGVLFPTRTLTWRCQLAKQPCGGAVGCPVPSASSRRTLFSAEDSGLYSAAGLIGFAKPAQNGAHERNRTKHRNLQTVWGRV